MTVSQELNTMETFKHLHKTYGKPLSRHIKSDAIYFFIQVPWKIVKFIFIVCTLGIGLFILLSIAAMFNSGGGAPTEDRDAAYWRDKYERKKYKNSVFRDAW